jgi:hypothetical protein
MDHTGCQLSVFLLQNNVVKSARPYVVVITAPLSDATRVGRLVAAERWRRGGIGDDGSGNTAGEDDDSTACVCALSPGVLYLPPGMARNLSLHLQTRMTSTATAAAAAAGNAPGVGGAAGAGGETASGRPQVIVTRVPRSKHQLMTGRVVHETNLTPSRPLNAAADALPPKTTTTASAPATVRRAATIAVAPVRAPAPALPAPPPAIDPW